MIPDMPPEWVFVEQHAERHNVKELRYYLAAVSYRWSCANASISVERRLRSEPSHRRNGESSPAKKTSAVTCGQARCITCWRGVGARPASAPKRKRPNSVESRDARRTALPRSLLTTTLRADLHCRNDSNVLRARSLTLQRIAEGMLRTCCFRPRIDHSCRDSGIVRP